MSALLVAWGLKIRKKNGADAEAGSGRSGMSAWRSVRWDKLIFTLDEAVLPVYSSCPLRLRAERKNQNQGTRSSRNVTRGHTK